MPKIVVIAVALLLGCMPLLSWGGKSHSNLGESDDDSAPCPSSPNCVASDALDSAHQVNAFQLAVTPAEAWPAVRGVVSRLPRTRIVSETADSLHVECRSTLFGFVDDLELHLRPNEGIIAVRSASRVGYSDFGVNRRRVENIRASLISLGVLK